MDCDSTEEEPVDYTAFEEKLFEEVRNGKDYQHFLNLSSQLDCMLIRSFLASMQIPTYVEGGNLNKIYGGTSTAVTTVFKMKLYILVEDYDEALEVVKDYIKNKEKSLSEKSGSDKYLKVLELMAAPYNISASQEMLGITIFAKKTKDEKPEGILQILKKFFTKNFAMCLLAICCMCFFSCTKKQIPFNQEQWLKEKNRYCMTDSLIEKLNKEKPNRQQIFNLLGKPKLEGRIADNEVDYFLKSEDFFTVWVFAVNFDDGGNFESAKVLCED